MEEQDILEDAKDELIQDSLPKGRHDMTDDEILRYTTNTHVSIANELTKGGSLPEGQETRKFLLDNLSQLSGIALKRKRLKADEAANATQAAQAYIMGKLLLQLGENDSKAKRTSAPILPDTIQPEKIVPGQLDMTAPPLNFDNFMPQFEKD